MPDNFNLKIEDLYGQEEPEHVFRFSARYPAITLPCFLLVAAALRYQPYVSADLFLYMGLIVTALMIERRRVCRAELGGFGLRCYGITGKLFMNLDRATIQVVDLDESVDGKDFYITARGRTHKIPMLYDGFHQMVGILEKWTEENRLSR